MRVAIVAHLLYLGHWFIVLNIWGGELGLFLSVIANNCVVVITTCHFVPLHLLSTKKRCE